jgi:hypothetical protein
MFRVIWIAAVLACGGRSSDRATVSPVAPPVATPDAGAPVDAAPLDQDLPRLAERSLAMYQDIVKAFTASGQDCAAAITRMHELTARYRDVATANARVVHDGRAKQLREALAPHSAELDAAAAAIFHSAVMSACGQDAAFSHAFDELVAPSS